MRFVSPTQQRVLRAAFRPIVDLVLQQSDLNNETVILSSVRSSRRRICRESKRTVIVVEAGFVVLQKF